MPPPGRRSGSVRIVDFPFENFERLDVAENPGGKIVPHPFPDLLREVFVFERVLIVLQAFFLAASQRLQRGFRTEKIGGGLDRHGEHTPCARVLVRRAAQFPYQITQNDSRIRMLLANAVQFLRDGNGFVFQNRLAVGLAGGHFPAEEIVAYLNGA